MLHVVSGEFRKIGKKFWKTFFTFFLNFFSYTNTNVNIYQATTSSYYSMKEVP